MSNYIGIQKEETFKAAVFRDFFNASKYAYEPNIGNIDFIVTEAKTLKGNIWKRHYLWAESKKGVADIHDMLTQLILTIKKTYEKGEYLPPPFVACFDTAKIAFVPFHDILPIFKDNDVSVNQILFSLKNCYSVDFDSNKFIDYLGMKKYTEENTKETYDKYPFIDLLKDNARNISYNIQTENIRIKQKYQWCRNYHNDICKRYNFPECLI